MTTAVLNRPLKKDAENLPIWEQINWKWVLQRIPMVLLAIVSSFGVGGFIWQSPMVQSFSWFGGIISILGAFAFDVTFLGVIALADQQLKPTVKSSILYWILNITASGLGALFNTLFYAGGSYEKITLESATHGIPYAVFGLMFALYYHEQMQGAIVKEMEDEAATKFKCKYCGEGKPTMNAIYGHYRSCSKRPKNP